MIIYLDNGKTIDLEEVDGLFDFAKMDYVEISVPDTEKKEVHIFECELLNDNESIGRLKEIRKASILN